MLDIHKRKEYHYYMSIYKPYQKFIKSISDYGLYTEIANKHMKILKEGTVVSSMSLTPGDTHVAIDHTLRYLIRNGHLPKVNRGNYVSELKRARK